MPGKIKSIIGIYPDGERQRFSIDNLEEMRIQEFSAVEIVEELTLEEFKKFNQSPPFKGKENFMEKSYPQFAID